MPCTCTQLLYSGLKVSLIELKVMTSRLNMYVSRIETSLGLKI
jgi:hypothetical protein